MFEWFPKYPATRLVLLLSSGLILSGLFYSAWWGPVATGVIIGIGAYLVIMLVSRLYLKKLTDDQQIKIIPWNALLTTILIAVIARQVSRNNFAWPVQFQTPNFFQPKSFFLILITIFLAVLLVAFRRSLSGGEGVAIESHWGGLGGGIGGFRLSTPLIYLLGIVSLLVGLAAVGLQVYVQPPQGAQPSASPTPTSTPTTTPTPEAAQSTPAVLAPSSSAINPTNANRTSTPNP